MADKAGARLQQVLDVLGSSEPYVRAYVHVREDEARDEAGRVDAQEPRSPLHGCPFAVKEVFEVAGVVTSGGCRALADNVANSDATVVARLRDAGAVLVGTQVSHELTCGLDQPPTRNPWNISHYPGGSSAGAGVSVAVGSAEFALGTDAAGSVRIPAAMTGTTGLKPTAGLISTTGVIRRATAPSIDNVGIIAGTAAEIAEILRVIAGPDPLDQKTLQAAAAMPPDAPPINGTRFAVLGPETRSALDEVHAIDPDVDRAFESACALLRDAGARISTIELPELPAAIGAVVTFFSAELAAAHRGVFEGKQEYYHASVAEMLRSSFDIPKERLEDAIMVRQRLRVAMDDVLAPSRAECLLTPTVPRVAMALSEFDPGEELGTLIPYTCGFNLTGHPAVSLPCGVSSGGLPIGLQMVARRYYDFRLLALAKAFQDRVDWHGRRPVLPKH